MPLHNAGGGIPQLPALWAEVAGVGARTTPPLSPASLSAHRKAPQHAPKWAGWYPYPTFALRGHKSAHRRQHGGQRARGAVWLGIFLFLLLFCSKIAIFRGEICRLLSKRNRNKTGTFSSVTAVTGVTGNLTYPYIIFSRHCRHSRHAGGTGCSGNARFLSVR